MTDEPTEDDYDEPCYCDFCQCPDLTTLYTGPWLPEPRKAPQSED